MLSTGHRRIVGFVVAVVLLSVLVVTISPYITALPTHLQSKRAASQVMGLSASLATTTASVRPVTTTSSAVVEVEQFVSTAPILSLICVHIC
jgi:hypothetical protein